MFRVGLIGSENSHAEIFADLFNSKETPFDGEFLDMRAVATYSSYPGVDEKLQEKFGVDFIAKSPEDMLGRVDAVMITARDGKYHAEYARPFVEAGIPAFVDKPFTRDVDEALELVRLAQRKATPLCGGSCLKLCPETLRAARFAEKHREEIITGTVMAPVNLKNEWGDFFFYSSHLAEICLPVFGYYPEWVSASETKNGVSVLVHYGDFDVACLYTENKWDYEARIVMAEETVTQPITLDVAFVEEAREFTRMLRTGRMEHSYEQLAQPVLFLNAVYRAMHSGQREAVGVAKL